MQPLTQASCHAEAGVSAYIRLVSLVDADRKIRTPVTTYDLRCKLSIASAGYDNNDIERYVVLFASIPEKDTMVYTPRRSIGHTCAHVHSSSTVSSASNQPYYRRRSKSSWKQAAGRGAPNSSSIPTGRGSCADIPPQPPRCRLTASSSRSSNNNTRLRTALLLHVAPDAWPRLCAAVTASHTLLYLLVLVYLQQSNTQKDRTNL